ncbi:MAG: hypothetical protein ACI4Q4_09805 [Oscillospiraceae bacterium]
MNLGIIHEEPLLSVIKPYDGDDLMIYAADLKAAEVGKSWETETQDQYPNRTETWVESFTVVYKDNHGVAVLHRREYCNEPDDVMLVWVELH